MFNYQKCSLNCCCSACRLAVTVNIKVQNHSSVSLFLYTNCLTTRGNGPGVQPRWPPSWSKMDKTSRAGTSVKQGRYVVWCYEPSLYHVSYLWSQHSCILLTKSGDRQSTLSSKNFLPLVHYVDYLRSESINFGRNEARHVTRTPSLGQWGQQPVLPRPALDRSRPVRKESRPS